MHCIKIEKKLEKYNRKKEYEESVCGLHSIWVHFWSILFYGRPFEVYFKMQIAAVYCVYKQQTNIFLLIVKLDS